jgi:uncharacterized membrane protein
MTDHSPPDDRTDQSSPGDRTDQSSPGDRTDQSSPGDRTDPQRAAPPHVGRGLLDADMGPSSALAHLYRGEIHRMKFWRERLDRTTNWAVIVIAALITWAFSSPGNPHYILLVGIATLSVFLVIEARRYRGYDIWRTRVRTLQQNVWAYGLDPTSGLVDETWRPRLADDYRTPCLKITAEEAIAHRLRRVYLPLFAVLLVAWLIRITAFADAPLPAAAAIGVVPGSIVLAGVSLFYAGACGVACRPRTWHAKGELRATALRKEE